MKQEFQFLSQDKRTQIHAIEWIPQGEVKAVVQLCHGMVEYVDRYHDFATFLANNGYYVVGHDHLGHGKSLFSSDRLGYFHKTKGNEYVIGDIHQLRVRMEKKFPNVPYFMFGHSMGSFLVRQYIGIYGFGLAGAIIMGTGDQPNVILGAGKLLCKMTAFLRGWKYRSSFIDGMAAGGYNKAFEKVTDGSNWLSRNPENVKRYKNDLHCGYMFTVNAYYHMFAGMMKMNRQEKAGQIPKRIPVLFVAGKEDPVGNFGKGVEKVYRRYKQMGVADVMIRLYEKDRHEILHELDKDKVYQDILKWLDYKI